MPKSDGIPLLPSEFWRKQDDMLWLEFDMCIKQKNSVEEMSRCQLRTSHLMLQSCIVFLFPVCYMLSPFSCHVGMLWGEICDISMLATPQKFCRVFPPALRFWTFNLYMVWLPSMTVSLCFCFSFSPIRHIWSQYFLFIRAKWYRRADRAVPISFLYLT